MEGNLEACVTALQEALSIEVTGYADLECAEGSCKAEAGASCAVAGSGREALGSLGFLFFALVFGARRRPWSDRRTKR